jgi:hypothetical protein
MLFISTANIVSVLALASTLTGLVLAAGPRPQCIGMTFISINLVSPWELTVAPSVYTEKYNVP